MDQPKDSVEAFMDELRAQFRTGLGSTGTIMQTWMSLTPHQQIQVLLQLMEQRMPQTKDCFVQTQQESKLGAKLDDPEQSRAEEKTQMKWIKFQAKKRKWDLDLRLEKIFKERDELEIMKIKLNQQKQEVENNYKYCLTTVTTVVAMKVTMEKSGAEIRTTIEKMLETQRKIRKDKEEVKNCMDKLASMKNQINKWRLTPSTILNTLTANALEDLPKEMPEGSQKATRSATLDGTNKAENIIKDDIFLQNLTELENKNQTENMTEINDIDNDQTKSLKLIEQNVYLEKQVYQLKEQEEEIKLQIKQTCKYVKEKSQEMTWLISETEEVQTQHPDSDVSLREMETVEQKGTMMSETKSRNVLLESTNVFIQTMLHHKQEDKGSGTDVKGKSDWIRRYIVKQKQTNGGKKDQKTTADETDTCSDKTELEILKTEIYKTQEIIRMLKLEFGFEDRNSQISRDLKNGENEITQLLQDMKHLQELLQEIKKSVQQNKIILKQETSTNKKAMNKRQRELDLRLEKTLRERDELEIMKIKMQRKYLDAQQIFEKMRKCKSVIERIAAQTEKNKEEISHHMKETEVKLRLLEDLKGKFDASKHHLKKMCPSRLLRSTLEKCKSSIKQKIDEESKIEKERKVKTFDLSDTDTEKPKLTKKRKGKAIDETSNEILTSPKRKKKTGDIKRIKREDLDQKSSETVQQKNDLNDKLLQRKSKKLTEANGKRLKDSTLSEQKSESEEQRMEQLKIIEIKKQELDDTYRKTKREIREKELLNSELTVKKKENKDYLRKIMRKIDENEKILNENKERAISIRREKKKKEKEFDRKLEIIRREKDALELMLLKWEKQKTGNVGQKQNIPVKYSAEQELVDTKKLNAKEKVYVEEKIKQEMMRSIKLKTTEKQEEIKQSIKEIGDKIKKSMKITKAELDKKCDNAKAALDQINKKKSKIQKMSLNVQQQSQTLQDSMKLLNLKHLERQRKNQDLQTLETEIHNRQKQLQEDTEDLDSLRKTIALVKDRVQAAMTSIGKDKEEVAKLKVEVEKDKDLISNEKSKLKEEWSKLETTKGELLKKTQSAENLEAKLQVLTDKTRENIQDKLNTLQQSQHAVQIIGTLLEQKIVAFDKQKEKMDDYKEVFERQKDILKRLLSDTIKKRLSMDNHWKQMAGMVTLINLMKERLIKDKEHVSTLKVHDEKDLLTNNFTDTMEPHKSAWHTVLIEKPKQFLITKCEKATQTDVVLNQAFTKQELKQSKMSKHFLTSSFETEHQPSFYNDSYDLMLAIDGKSERNNSLPENKNVELQKVKHATLTTISTIKDDFINQENRDSLRKIWKDTRTDRREIDVLKHRGQKIRSNLEKRLKVISHFVERTLSFNEKTPIKTTSEYLHPVNQSDWNRDNKSLDKRYFDLNQPMFTESESHLKERESKEPTTGNKAKQAAGLDTITEQAKEESSTRISEELSRMRVQEDKPTPETSSGFFCQLQHYCCRCCCRCCSCHMQGCPKKN